jgi:uncharacterized protein (TIGR03435 family)
MVLAAILMAFAAGSLAEAQSPPPPGPRLEIASVTRNTSRERGSMGMYPDGRFVAVNATLRLLIREAYRVQDFQIVGDPAWASTDRFDVTVKAAPGAVQAGGPVPPVQQILRALLADRFTLRARNESREMPAFELRLDADKRPGPGLKESDVDCLTRARGGPPPAPSAPGERPRCGLRMGPGRLTAGGMPMSELAIALSQVSGRPVVDRTGLTRGYDIELSWTPEQFQRGRGSGTVATPAGVDPNGPNLFQAVRDQLGLMLEFGQATVQVLFIDAVEDPTK